ncbi:hypothetical protein AURDEDRAFT_159623 [Auricularia subglabra TFB-10046 SS5]|nr:hypothetical protein AURDEDRAFT_159623 [Auricularia subglabra TFB-10046 SS5]
MFAPRLLVYLALLVPASLGGPIGARTVAQVEADLATIGNGVNSLNTALNSLNAGNLLAALAIHTSAGNLANEIQTGTTDTTNTAAFSEADGTAVLNAVRGFQPNIITALNTVVAKKPIFQGLPVGGVPTLVKQDLALLNTNTKALENALTAKAPADLQSQAQALIAPIDAAFASATAAYAEF